MPQSFTSYLKDTNGETGNPNPGQLNMKLGFTMKEDQIRSGSGLRFAILSAPSLRIIRMQTFTQP